jgi:aminoglycoside phosphotransferase family enzyme/predicted kinase
MSGDRSGADDQSSTKTQPSLGHRMLSAEFPHSVDEIQLLETHISWVILTGPYAYKLKKPLRLDFLDYSTLQLRKKYCDRELQINKVWAESIYKDVVAVFDKAGQLRVGTANDEIRDGETIVDYAVMMNQFPQSALLAEQLKTGAITPAVIEPLGEEIAHLHQRLDSIPYHDSLVRDGAIDPAIENFDYLLSQLSVEDPDHDRAAKLKLWTLDSIERLKPLMERRARKGSVIACHGDLHLGNILYLDGRFIPFDGVEFNDAFSQVEGLDEIAFLAMELSEHGYRSHARRLVNRYVETTGDYESLLLLRYFLVYRAMVRAKVDMIRQTQCFGSESSGQATGQPRLSAAGRQYLDYAESVLGKSAPELWITYGLSGSGKSTASNKVIESHGFFRVRSDVQRKLIACRDPYEKTAECDLPQLYSGEMTVLTYQRMLTIADQILRSGFGVIVDAAFLRHDLRRPFQGLACQYQIPYRILVCEAATEELKARLANRGSDPSDADESVLDAQIKIAEAPSGAENEFIVWASSLV